MKKYLIALAASLFFALVITPSKTIAAPELITKEDIINFQKSKGLKPDGIMGPRTKEALRAEKKETVIEKSQKTESVRIKKKTAAVLPVKEPCHFLFWDVECSNNQIDPAAIVNNSSKPQLRTGLQMVGMDSRKNRVELENRFASTIGQRVDPVRIPWCAAWANAVLAESGMETTGSLMARSFLGWGVPTHEPHEGDVVVLRRGRNREQGHVGFYIQTVEMQGKKFVAVLGGNQGKGVSIAYYPKERVVGYRTAA